MGSIRRTPPRASFLAAVLAAVVLVLPQVADARVTSTSTGASAPAAPTGLTAGRTPTSIAPALSWNASSGAIGYRVYRNGSQVAKVTTPTYSDSGLTVSGSYRYAVRSLSQSGLLSSASSAVTVVYDVIAPSPVTGLSGPSVTNGSLSLQWSAATDTGGSGVAGYNVRLDDVYLGDRPPPPRTQTPAC